MKCYDLDNIEKALTVTIGKVGFPDAYFDAFSRLRTSEVTTQIDLKQQDDNLPLYFDEETIGAGASAHSTLDARSRMTVTNSGDVVIRQTKMRFNYQSGKSQLIEMTMANFEAQTDVVKKMGYYSSSTVTPFILLQDGLFLQSDDTGISINIYKEGFLQEQTYQSNWNIDTFDGNGISGIDIDWSKGNILVIDFQWLGVGRVRWGLSINGVITYFHESLNANSGDSVYISSPNQPIRYEIRSVGGAGTLDHICSAVGTEGARNKLGTIFSFNTGSTAYAANIANTKYAFIAFRLKDGYLDAVVDLLIFSLLGTSPDNFLWEFHINPTLGIAPTYVPQTNSAIEVAILPNNTLVTADGSVLDSGYVSQRVESRNQIENALRLGVAIAGAKDVGVITITPLSNNLTLFGSFTRREII